MNGMASNTQKKQLARGISNNSVEGNKREATGGIVVELGRGPVMAALPNV